MMTRLRSAGAIAALLAIGAWGAAPSPAAAQDATLIVPGQSMGNVTIGMSEGALYNLLGAPKSTFNQPDRSIVYTFEVPALLVTTDEGKVYRVGTRDPKFHTREGIHVGTSLLELHARLGQPDCTETLSPPEVPVSMSERYEVYGPVSFIMKGGLVSEISTKRRPFRCSD